jgi:hypothetical protein
MHPGAPGNPRRDPSGQRLAAIVIVANDETRIGAALDSIAWADEIHVVDLGSTDRSADVCAARGITPLSLEALPAALEKGSVQWVLLMEGHEEMSSPLRHEIEAVVRSNGPRGGAAGYRMRRRVRFLGRSLRNRGVQARDRIRLARRDALHWNAAARMPCSLPAQGMIRSLEGAFLSEPGRDLQHYVGRMDIVSSSAARMLQRAGWKARWRDVAVVPVVHGMRTMPGAAMRDGIVGVMFAVLEAYAIVVIRAKCWELQHVQGGR